MSTVSELSSPKNCAELVTAAAANSNATATDVRMVILAATHS